MVLVTIGHPTTNELRRLRRWLRRRPTLTSRASGRQGERLYDDRLTLARRAIDGRRQYVLEVEALEGAGLSEWDYAETAIMEVQHAMRTRLVVRILCSHMERPVVWRDGRTHWSPDGAPPAA